MGGLQLETALLIPRLHMIRKLHRREMKDGADVRITAE